MAGLSTNCGSRLPRKLLEQFFWQPSIQQSFQLRTVSVASTIPGHRYQVVESVVSCLLVRCFDGPTPVCVNVVQAVSSLMFKVNRGSRKEAPSLSECVILPDGSKRTKREVSRDRPVIASMNLAEVVLVSSLGRKSSWLMGAWLVSVVIRGI